MKTEDLAKRLKELRAMRGMSQEYLAEESRVGLRTIQRIENKESKPTGETIKRIANALDVTLTELVGTKLLTETGNIKATMIFLKKQLSKTDNRSEIKTFEKFIALLQKLDEKELSMEKIEGIENYIQYLELEKIPSFHSEIYKQKLSKFKKYLRQKLGFVPENFYTTWIASFSIAFAAGFAVQSTIDYKIKIGVISAVLLLIVIGLILDYRVKKQKRSLSF